MNWSFGFPRPIGPYHSNLIRPSLYTLCIYVQSMYVDKHRQAAVVMGERDVKADVKKKKKRER